MFGPKFKKFFNTPLVSSEVRAIIDRILLSLSLLVSLLLFGWVIALLPKVFQLAGNDGDALSFSVQCLTLTLVMSIRATGGLVPRYEAIARKTTLWLFLFCALTMIMNIITQRF